MASVNVFAPNKPAFPIIVIGAVVETFAVLALFPQHLPENPLVYTLIRCLGLNVILYLVYLVEIWPRMLSPLRHLPRPKGAWPFIGHGFVIIDRPPGRQFLDWVTKVPNDGLIHWRGLANQDRLLVTNPKALAEILVTHPYDFEKPLPARTFLRRILGDGLIIVEGDVHKFQRKNVMPSFSFRHLKELYPMMWKKSVALTQGLTDELRRQATTATDDGKPAGVLEVNHWANKVTMDIIGVAAMGREFNALQNDDDELIQNYEELLEPTIEKLLYFAVQLVGPQNLVNKLPWKLNDRVKYLTTNLRKITTRLVHEKRAAIKADADQNIDLLSILIRSNNFSDDELVDQMLTFLAAGHETTSSAFTWTTYNLATNPEWQHKLREELHEHMPLSSIPKSGDDFTAILESLPILNGICEETIRLYPTVPITVRDTVKDTTLVGVPIPKNTQIIISPWAINRSPHLWSNADKFRPERWIGEDGKPNKNGGATSNYSLLTFLHGPRSCIGQNFAKEELRCLVAAFTLSFEWEMADPNEEVRVAGVVTTKPANGMNLRLKAIS